MTSRLREGLESNVLRFLGKMATDDPVNRDRVFIISFYLGDDTISVFEPPQRNSGQNDDHQSRLEHNSSRTLSSPHLSPLPIPSSPGVLGGKFLERGRIKKPGQELFKSEMSQYFCARDLFVGARLALNNQAFQLVDADDYAFNYMEQHAEEVGEHSTLTSLNASLL